MEMIDSFVDKMNNTDIYRSFFGLVHRWRLWKKFGVDNVKDIKVRLFFLWISSMLIGMKNFRRYQFQNFPREFVQKNTNIIKKM